jgi:hypothetical protein
MFQIKTSVMLNGTVLNHVQPWTLFLTTKNLKRILQERYTKIIALFWTTLKRTNVSEISDLYEHITDNLMTGAVSKWNHDSKSIYRQTRNAHKTVEQISEGKKPSILSDNVKIGPKEIVFSVQTRFVCLRIGTSYCKHGKEVADSNWQKEKEVT